MINTDNNFDRWSDNENDNTLIDTNSSTLSNNDEIDNDIDGDYLFNDELLKYIFA